MKSLLFFIRNTIAGGVLFILPVGILIFFFNKIDYILLKIASPIEHFLPKLILGFDGKRLVALVILLIICFLSGLFFRSVFVKKSLGYIEDNILVYIPGYNLFKSIAADAVGEKLDSNMTAVLVKDEENWNLGFLVEEGKTHSTVFLPEVPKHDSGEVKIVPNESVRKLNIKTSTFIKNLNAFGKGVVQFVD